MVHRKGGYRRKSRHKMSKPLTEKGKISLTKFLQEFTVNEKVYMLMEPGVQKGKYPLRFYGASGIITGKKGRCYEVTIKHMNATRKFIVHPVHLKKA
ncbi:50S ribosomal protein L21e [Candidatus Woesearchaeota archaeon]|nr:MAG: 50S ribosomal protein L21e [Candidatus Woesearchaeota archaeon]